MKDLLLLLQAAITAVLVANANCQSACTLGDVRLVGGSSNLEGRVEVCNDAGLWGTVCDDGWTEVDANVVCGQLGHSHEDAVARTGAYYGRGSGGIFLDDVDCAGFEDRLIDCDHRGIGVHDCIHYEDAGVVCQQGVNVTFVKDDFTDLNTSIEAIRLVNGLSASMGRLELLYNGTWGTVCDTYWSYSDAKVACRMLDFDDAVCAVRYNEFGIASSSVPFWMSRLLCTGSEEALDSCSFPGWGYAYRCSHSSNDAGIVCINFSDIGVPYDIQMTNSTTRTISLSWRVPKLPEGLRNVRFTVLYTSQVSLASSSTSFTVGGSTLHEGDIVTRTLYSLQRSTAYDIQISTSVQYSACSTYYPGNYSDTVTLRTSNITKESNISVRLISPYSGADFLGRVEVYYDGQWGTVCDNYFSTPEADVICGMLNYSAAQCVISSARYGQGSGPVWLENLDCSGNDEVIEDCTHYAWGVTYCRHYEDVGVICQPNEDDFPAVQNVRVSSTGATSVTVSWARYTSFPNGASSTQFIITYSYGSSRRTATASSTATEYTLSNLQFDREYSIRVRPRVQYRYCYSYIYGPYSNEVNITTTETAPSGPPSLFHIQAINESAIEAQWNLPRASERNGIIRGYKLFVLTNGRPDVVIDITNNDTLVYIISGLEPRRAYTISVLAYTVADGPRSIHLTAVTRERDQSLIAGFGVNADGVDRVTRYTYSSPFTVQCTPSLTTNVTVQWFLANGSRIGTSYASNIRQRLYSNGTNILRIGSGSRLSYCDGGMFTCMVNDTMGRTERRTFHLVIGSSPPTPSRPTVLRRSGNKVTIGWLQSDCQGGHVPSYFKIRYRRTSYYYSSYTYITVADPTQRSYEVTGLSYSTSYYFYIQVTTTDSRTSSYSSSAYITTLSNPPSVPRDVRVSLIRPLLVEVSWRVPSFSGGSISQYTVLATPVSLPSKRKRKRQATTAEVIKKVFPSNTTSTEITLTHHSITYTFQVSAASGSSLSLNEGDYSSVTAGSILYVPEPGLPKPTRVRITTISNASLTITWNYPPPPADPISNFYITYSGDVEWRSPGGNLIQFSDDGEMTVNSTQVTLSPLFPGTRYLIKVSAISSRGRGEEVMLLSEVGFSQEKLAFFQLRLSPVVNCHSFLNQGENITEKLLTFRRQIVRTILLFCPSCGITTSNIRDDEFSCRGGLTNHIVYRAMILGTSRYSPLAFISLIQSWVRSGSASITLQSTRLYLDQDCSIFLDTLRDPDCPFVTSEPPPTTTTPTTPTTVKTTTASTPTTTEARVVSGQVTNQINGIDVGGFVVAVVIIVLISVLLVVIIILVLKWKSGKKKSNAYSVVNQPLSGTCSTDQLHKESANTDDDHKEEYTL